MRTRVLNYFTNATQSSREQNASLIHMKLAPRVHLTKEMSGRSLRGRSAQAQVQVRGYKEEKLGLAVRTLCFICPSYRSHDCIGPDTYATVSPFSLSRLFPAAFVTTRYWLLIIRAPFSHSASWTKFLDKLDSLPARRRITTRR